MKRSEFLRITLAAAGASLLGCGDDDGGADSGGTDSGGMDAGGMDSGGDDAGGDDAGGDDAGGDDAGGDDAGGDDAGAMCAGDSIEADISNNHEHTLTIPVADIIAGEEKQYVTGGTTGHCHIVTITAEDFATLAAGGTVRVVSCNNTEHEYALSCVEAVTANDPAPTCGSSDDGRYTDGCTGDTFTP